MVRVGLSIESDDVVANLEVAVDTPQERVDFARGVARDLFRCVIVCVSEGVCVRVIFRPRRLLV